MACLLSRSEPIVVSPARSQTEGGVNRFPSNKKKRIITFPIEARQSKSLVKTREREGAGFASYQQLPLPRPPTLLLSISLNSQTNTIRELEINQTQATNFVSRFRRPLVFPRMMTKANPFHSLSILKPIDCCSLANLAVDTTNLKPITV